MKMKTKSYISRRQFLRVAGAALGGVALSVIRRLLGRASDTVNERIFLPQIIISPIPPGRVVHIHSLNATHWAGETAFWDHVDQTTVNAMVDQGLMLLTRAQTVADAWRVLLPEYQPGQIIAIKVNFNNNSSNCTDTDNKIDGLIQPVNALVSGLAQIGVAPSDIHVYDAIRALPDRFVNMGLSGIEFFDANCRNTAGFNYVPASKVTFYPPEGVLAPDEWVNNALMNATYLINMPIMKGNHTAAGVTLGAKNHFGTVNSPSGMHNLVNIVGGTARHDYNPLVDLLRSPLIGGKTILTVGDGLFAARHFNQAPETWSTFGNQVPNSLFFSVDKVSVDCIMHDLLAAELGAGLSARANEYLRLAGAAGLGVFEQGDPWQEPFGSGYQKIQYIRTEV